MSATLRSINCSRNPRLPLLTPTSISIRNADRSTAPHESRCKTRRPNRFLRFTSPTSNSLFRTLDSIGHSTWSAAHHVICTPSTHWISRWPRAKFSYSHALFRIPPMDSATATSRQNLPTTEHFSTRVSFRRLDTIRAMSSMTRAVAAKNTLASCRKWRSAEIQSTRAEIYFVPSSDWITFHTIVSTSADQIAIAPGYLQRAWKQNNRNYYEYSMGSTHIADFFAFLSARYATRKEVYNGPNGPVNLEVYYYPTHTYDIDDMLASSRAGLDYYQTHYSPYQFTQYRIMEFPRYREFRAIVSKHCAVL